MVQPQTFNLLTQVRFLVAPPDYYAVCPGGEGAVLKTVGLKGLAGSNPVHGAIRKILDFFKKLSYNKYI